MDTLVGLNVSHVPPPVTRPDFPRPAAPERKVPKPVSFILKPSMVFAYATPPELTALRAGGVPKAMLIMSHRTSSDWLNAAGATAKISNRTTIIFENNLVFTRIVGPPVTVGSASASTPVFGETQGQRAGRMSLG